MNWFLRLLGLAEKEYDHIVADFHTAIDDLKSLRDRKLDEAADLRAEIIGKTSEMNSAEYKAHQAANTAQKIQALVA